MLSFLSRLPSDRHSPLYQDILSAFLKPTESTPNLGMDFYQASRDLVLDLPRFTLSFTPAEGESTIKSKHYSGMCIDELQGIGTFVELENKIVLRQEGICAM